MKYFRNLFNIKKREMNDLVLYFHSFNILHILILFLCPELKITLYLNVIFSIEYYRIKYFWRRSYYFITTNL